HASLFILMGYSLPQAARGNRQEVSEPDPLPNSMRVTFSAGTQQEFCIERGITFHCKARWKRGRICKAHRRKGHMTSRDYDGILLGAGHNSLILQAYLGRAGLKTLCLEQRDVPGGGLTTMEDARHPRFLHNTHSFFHRALNRMPWYRDLELE